MAGIQAARVPIAYECFQGAQGVWRDSIPAAGPSASESLKRAHSLSSGHNVVDKPNVLADNLVNVESIEA